MKKAEAVDTTPVAASGEGGQTAFLGASVNISEYPADTYKGLEDSCKDTVGIVFVGRASGEGGDLYTKEYADGTPHQLALTEAEKETIQFAKRQLYWSCSGNKFDKCYADSRA